MSAEWYGKMEVSEHLSEHPNSEDPDSENTGEVYLRPFLLELIHKIKLKAPNLEVSLVSLKKDITGEQESRARKADTWNERHDWIVEQTLGYGWNWYMCGHDRYGHYNIDDLLEECVADVDEGMEN